MADQKYIIEFVDKGIAEISKKIDGVGKSALTAAEKTQQSRKAIEEMAQKSVASYSESLKSAKEYARSLNDVSTAAKSAQNSGSKTGGTAWSSRAKQSIIELNKAMGTYVGAAQRAGTASDMFSTKTWNSIFVMAKLKIAAHAVITSFDRVAGAMIRIASGAITSAVNGFKRLAESILHTIKRMTGLAAILSAIGAAFGIREIARYSDEWTMLTNRVRLYTKSEEELISVRGQLLDVSRATRSSIHATSQLYMRLAISQEKLQTTTSDMVKFTELFQKSLATSGSTTQEQESAIIQLSQGMGDVALKGREFVSVMKATPTLMLSVANAMGMTVAQLKDLSAQGKVTSKDFYDAVLSREKEIRASFAKTVSTFEQLKTVYRNVMIEVFGTSGEQTGVFSSLTETLLEFADKIRSNIDKIVASVLTARDIVKGLVSKEGFGGAFLEVTKSGAVVFGKIVLESFKASIPIFKMIATVMSESFVDSLLASSPKLAGFLGLTEAERTIEKLNRLTQEMRNQLVSGVSENDLFKASGKQFGTYGTPDQFEAEGGSLDQIMDAAKNYSNSETIAQLLKMDAIAVTDLNAALVGLNTDELLATLSKSADSISDSVLDSINALSELGTDTSAVELYLANLEKIRVKLKEIQETNKESLDLNFWGKTKEAFNQFKTDFSTGMTDAIAQAGELGTIFAETLADAVNGFSDEFAKMVVTGKADFKSLAQSIIQDLIRMIMQKQIFNALDGFGLGGGGTTLTKNQFGGSVQANVPTMVGERRPEIFVPQSAGKIVPYPKQDQQQQSIRIINAVSGDAVLQNASRSVIDKIVMNVISGNTNALRGMLA